MSGMSLTYDVATKIERCSDVGSAVRTISQCRTRTLQKQWQPSNNPYRIQRILPTFGMTPNSLTFAMGNHVGRKPLGQYTKNAFPMI